MTGFFSAASLLLLMGLMVFGAAAQEPALRVDAGQPLGAINPAVLGANYGPWALVSVDMTPAAAESGVTHLRFPAGRHGDTHGFTRQQLDLFMMQVRAWGAVPSVSVRLEGGTPEEAAEMVRYANLEKGYDIRHWSIGNEPDLYVGYTVERFNAEWRAFAEAMRAVDPDIVLIGPEVSQFPYTPEGDAYTNLRREWVRAFLEANGDLVDIVAVHRYPFPLSANLPPTTVEDLRQNAPQWEVVIDNLRTVIRETVGHDMPMALTEINSNWTHVIGGEASPDSFYHAIWWADVLGRMIRQRVDVVDYFVLATSGSDGAFGLISRYEVRPTYYVYPLYRRLGSALIASESPDPDVTITAALRDDGALTLIVVNRAPDARAYPLALTGFTPAGDAQVWRLDAEHNAAPVAPVVVADGSVLELPAQSVTLYILPR
ncbi:MAG: hypothetical protein L6Q98_11295 [Anaerolineae bacterium]|nr:hypothetical protein [Anaerolineae bacterium]NUQ05537.1 hypothetical protein [Anaerolineae bacterium]